MSKEKEIRLGQLRDYYLDLLTKGEYSEENAEIRDYINGYAETLRHEYFRHFPIVNTEGEIDSNLLDSLEDEALIAGDLFYIKVYDGEELHTRETVESVAQYFAQKEYSKEVSNDR